MGGVWSSQVCASMGRFGQHNLRYAVCAQGYGVGLFNNAFCVFPGIQWILWTKLHMHFESWLAWEVFGQHKLICILCVVWHGMGFGEHMLSYILCLRWHGIGLVKHLWWYILCPRWHLMAWSTLVAMNFLFVLAWERLVNTCWDIISVYIGIRGG